MSLLYTNTIGGDSHQLDHILKFAAVVWLTVESRLLSESYHILNPLSSRRILGSWLYPHLWIGKPNRSLSLAEAPTPSPSPARRGGGWGIAFLEALAPLLCCSGDTYG